MVPAHMHNECSDENTCVMLVRQALLDPTFCHDRGGMGGLLPPNPGRRRADGGGCAGGTLGGGRVAMEITDTIT